MYQQESAKPGGAVIFLTWMTVVLLFVVTASMIAAGILTNGIRAPISGIFWGVVLFLAVGSAVLLWLCYTQKPGLIRIEAGKLVLERRAPWQNIEVDLGQLTRVEILDKLPRFTWRLLGNGGVFCFSGSFYNRSLGRFRASITTLHNLVLVSTPQKTIVISPADPQGFINYITSNYTLVPS